MNREQAEKLLAALIFDDLDEASKAELLAYLQTDDELRERLADMRMAAKLACDAVNEGPDPVLSKHRLKQLERLAKTNRPRLLVFTRRRLAAVAAVLVFGVVMAGMLIPSLSKVKRYSAPMVALAQKEIEAKSLEQSIRLRAGRNADVEGYESDEIRKDLAEISNSEDVAWADVASSSSRRGRGGRSDYGGMGSMGGYGMGADTPAVAQGEPSAVAGSRPGATVMELKTGLSVTETEDRVALNQSLPEPRAVVANGPVARSVTLPSDIVLSYGRPAQTATGGGGYEGAVPYGWSGTVTPERPSSGVVSETRPSGGPQDGDSSHAIVRGLTDADQEWFYRLQDDSKQASVVDSLELGRKAIPDRESVAQDGRATSAESAGQPVTSMPATMPAIAVGKELTVDSDSIAPAKTKAPALGDVPAVGGLFRGKSVADEQSQVPAEISNLRPSTEALSSEKLNQTTVVNLKEEAERLRGTSSEDASDLPCESRFKVVPVNPWVMTERDAQSTFALDVDTASYALCRRYIRSGFLPPFGAVRMEEFINSFDYAYPQRDNPTFAVYAEGAPSPFAPAGQYLTLLKIAVKARTVGRDQRRAAHLVFVIDASASMGQPDRLGAVQSALDLLIDRLSDGDRVSLVTCANEARLHLEAVSAWQKDTIRGMIDAIQPAGPTNLLAGLKLGYATARRAFVAGQINQVVLCSDGVANVGQIEADAVLAEVADDRRQGITLTCVGVGYGAYNDAFLEALAGRGDGRYVFLDSAPEAQEALVGQLADTLQTVAKDARIQVQFNPTRVRRYRLVGYENRDIKDQRFRDDTIDAGEVGSGQCSTALYELELMVPAAGDSDTDIGAVFVRYRDTDTGSIEEIARPLAGSIVRRRSVEEDPRFYLAAGAARLAEWLRQSEHVRDTTLADVQRLLEKVSVALPLDRDIQDLAALARQAENLPRAP